MANICKYYIVRKIKMNNNQLSKPCSRGVPRPVIAEGARCTHEKSKHIDGAMGVSCPCNGDIKKCVIPEFL